MVRTLYRNPRNPARLWYVIRIKVLHKSNSLGGEGYGSVQKVLAVLAKLAQR